MITITQASGVFTDMGNHVWAQTAVNSLYQRGIITGQSATEYGPANALKRGDFVLMLYRAFNLTATNTTNNFTDVPKDSYYATAINVANALGIAQGGDGIFRPEAPLTREDAMILIQRTLTVKGRPYPAGTSTTLSKFPDSKNISSYAVDAAAALVQASVITGDEKGNLNPKKALTRAEMAVILYRVLPS